MSSIKKKSLSQKTINYNYFYKEISITDTHPSSIAHSDEYKISEWIEIQAYG
jgi:hypothetical protein